MTITFVSSNNSSVLSLTHTKSIVLFPTLELTFALQVYQREYDHCIFLCCKVYLHLSRLTIKFNHHLITDMANKVTIDDCAKQKLWCIDLLGLYPCHSVGELIYPMGGNILLILMLIKCHCQRNLYLSNKYWLAFIFFICMYNALMYANAIKIHMYFVRAG